MLTVCGFLATNGEEREAILEFDDVIFAGWLLEKLI